MRSRALQALGAAAAAGGAAVAYGAVLERNWFALRRFEVPVLPAGLAPVRVLHISDVHLTPKRHLLMSWIRALDALEPDLVVNTGDSIGHPEAIRPFMEALGPLLDRPGIFVYGSNDLYQPRPRNPVRYLWRSSAREFDHNVPNMPWPELGEAMVAAGWMDANNKSGRIKAGDLDIEVAGVHDSHTRRDRYDQIAGPTDPAADLRLGVMHSPEPRVMDQFTADGYDLLLAGHTHGGQLRVPLYGALVTNCGLDPRMARGLYRYPGGDPAAGWPGTWLNVSAGLGTSPWAPIRFCCRPEATLLTLVPRIG
jgi:predicted MPP superfamily phosphohydrolase